MIKYSEKIIQDYVLGNDIELYNIDELENDKSFMMDVINFTNDKKMFVLCGDEIKNNTEFLKFIIDKFCNDLEFICNLALNFIMHSKDEADKAEVLDLMIQKTKGNIDHQIEFLLYAETTYLTKRIEIESFKDNEEYFDDSEMGFIYIFNQYNYNKRAIDFYAKYFIDEIITNINPSLEDILHKKFKNKEDIEKYGINNYMLELINKYDHMLSSYLSGNIFLLSNLEEKINNLISNWDEYLLNLEYLKYNIILEKIHEYMSENDYSILSETSLLYYVGNELGIAEKISKYDEISDDLYRDLITYLNIEYISNIIKVSDIDRINYNNVKNIVKKYLSIDTKTELNTESEKKGKIIKLNIKN